MTARDAISKALFISDASDGWGKDATEIGDACYAVADVLLAAGFGDVTEAKATALDEAAALNDEEAASYELGENAEGWPVTSLNNASEKMRKLAAEYRAP